VSAVVQRLVIHKAAGRAGMGLALYLACQACTHEVNDLDPSDIYRLCESGCDFDAFCAAYTHVRRDRMAECSDGSRNYYDVTIKSYCDEFGGAVNEGRLIFDPHGAHECLSAVQNASCGRILSGGLRPCETVLVGNVSMGDLCVDGECATGLFCANGCPRTCERTQDRAAGERCSDRFVPCRDGSACVETTGDPELRCRLPSGIGAPCLLHAIGCIDAAFCELSSGICHARKPPGADCASITECEIDLVCAGENSDRMCTPYSRVGQECVPGDGDCERVGFCNDSGICTMPPLIGESCGETEDPLCAGGAYCGGLVCEPFIEVGGRCSDDRECRSGFCDTESRSCQNRCP
jgi:hypothetical protein